LQDAKALLDELIGNSPSLRHCQLKH
jgi:hypothetical protein